MTNAEIDRMISEKIRPFMIEAMIKGEIKFINDVKSRRAMTQKEAMNVLEDWRPEVAKDFEERVVPEVREWLLSLAAAAPALAQEPRRNDKLKDE